jgi:Zn finger protein HypA/HybF involved in hydrogenase expression
MGLFATLRDAFAASTQSTDRGTGTSESTGAYWCHDCAERVPARDVSGEDAPSCPECGDAMELERSPGTTGCAC